jgi:hypothetical protein
VSRIGKPEIDIYRQGYTYTFEPDPTSFRSGSGREPYSRGQWGSALKAPRKPPGVMLQKAGACTQPVRSDAHDFRSHGPR